MHTGQFRVVPIHRSRFLAVLARNYSVVLHSAVALSLLQSCGGGSSTSTSSPLAITTTTLTGGTVTESYTATLTAAGGTGGGYTWSVSAGALPAGITLAGSGVLSGTPTAAGTFNFTAAVTDSSQASASASLSLVIAAAGPLTNYEFTGDTSPVHDPSIIRQNSTYYVFSTDASSSQGGFIPIRCSTDKIAWTACGYVFTTLPSWISGAVPQATEIWAPDVSYFNSFYHVYYAVSSFGSNVSAIGLVTNTTLDSTDPNYSWVDQGLILQSSASDNFNAIDPNILIDAGGNVWLTYGSFWTGIYQQQINPATGQIQSGSATYHLAQRTSTVANDPVEGSSLIYENGFYYLFVSWDYCCETNPSESDYKIVVGRGTSPNGPFTDQSGVDMAAGGGTILLQGDATWAGPGGQTAYVDPTDGDLIVFHALQLSQNGLDYLFVRSLAWSNDWPVIGSSTDAGSDADRPPTKPGRRTSKSHAR
jgi:arabinan endo-1,5-alpha-L-arabinosidase